ncbi:MAG TPA: carboxypeptidase-like regulatory domain-containing protein [Acidobacteriaceae bacterium]|nr:carboxypeptidase-like regulatory domain-containing protein [Acidobacteriaceae bacterium]
MKALTQAWRLGLLAAVSLALFLPSAKAQTVYGSMAGTVSDSTGAVIPNAKIQAKNETTGTVSSTVSTSAGAYRFPELPIGTYDLTVTAPGFQTDSLTGIRVDLQVTTAQNITMQVGGATQTVTINASAIHLQTETSDVTGSISDQDYLKLPLALGGVGAFRSPEAFIFLLPGNTGPGTTNSGNGIFFSKIAGGQDYGAEVLIDGVSQQRSENGSSFDEEAPGVDALRELTVTDAVPPAEYNRTTGGIENFATKSGSNSFHGSAYELFKNQALDANDWFNGGLRVLSCAGPNDTLACRARFATPVDRKNDYGGTFSGPVWIPHIYNGHDRLFFFFSWEQLKYAQGGETTTTVPTAQELSGDFSNPVIFPATPIPGAINPCDGTPILKGQIFDPSTTRVVNGVECRTAFPGNKIPSGDFSKVAGNVLQYFPAPTNNGVFGNFNFASSSPIENTTSTIRVDASITEKSKIWSSYSDRDNNRISGAPPLLPYPIDFATWKQDFETHFWRLGWDYSFSPTLLNHLIIGTNRSNSINFAVPALEGKNWMSSLGIGNAVSNNFPVVTNGFTAQEGMPNNGDNIDNGIRLVESLEWQKGAHSLDFGADIRYQQYSPINNNSPSINFCGAQTAADPSQTAQTGNGLASEMLGDACNGGQNVYVHQSRWISWYYSGYVQDNWKASRNLTLNLGVNYSVDAPRHEADNETSNFSPTAIDPEFGVPGALVFGTSCNGCNTAWADTYYKDVAPRIGFAYSPAWLNGKTVIRGGAGILYGPLQYDDFGGSMDSGYKANPSFNSANGFDPSFQIDNGYPAFKQPPDLDPGLFNGAFMSGSYIEKNAAHPAKVYDFDLQVQQQLSNEMILSVGFVGSEAQNLQANNQNINNMPLQDIALGDELTTQLQGNSYGVSTPFPGYFTLWGNGITIQQALRPFPQYDFIDSGCCLQDTGHSSYDALLVSLKRQMSNGLSFQASYTWQKNENDTDSALPNTNPGQPQVQNPANLHAEKAISVQDIPQTFVISYIYELPFGQHKKFLNTGPVSYIAGGWQIGGIQRYQSGVPVAFCCSSGIPGWQQAIRYNELPNTNIKSSVYRSGWKHLNPFAGSVGGGVPTSDPNTNSLFNGAVDNNAPAYKNGTAQPAFVDQNLPQYRNGGAFHLGNTPRVTNIHMPSYFDEDFSLIKDTPIRENLVFELKVEALGAFNRHHFTTPDTNPGDTTFGVPTNTFGPGDTNNGARQLQITGRIQF